jgi:hypothetical protein
MNEGTGIYTMDSSGNGNHGTLVGMANPPSATSGWGPGPHGGALRFDGNGTVNCGNKGSLIPAGDKLSILTIFNAISSQVNYPGLIVKGTIVAANTDSYGLRLSKNLFGGIVYTTSLKQVYTDVLVNDDKTHFGCMVYDGVNINIYLDGVLNGQIAQTGNINNVNADLLIGNSNTYNFKGYISSVSIYNRALLPEEVAYLYAFPYCMFDQKGAFPCGQ